MGNSGQILAALFLAGLLGLIGQGIRAVVGLKKAAAVPAGKPDQQSTFDAAYLAVSMMIGFIAGALAGLSIGLDQVNNLDISKPADIKVLLGIIVLGYAGADFIEGAFSQIIPGLAARTDASQQKADADNSAPQAPAKADIDNLTSHMRVLAGSVSALSSAITRPSVPAAPASEPSSTAFPTLGAALRIVAPKVDVTVWQPALIAAFTKFDLTTDRRVAAAVGQFLVEAGAGFQETVENLNYTHAERIAEVFRRKFADAAAAAPYVGKPQALGNFVYANELGNGNEASGDGFGFRGRGLIQITGRDEYSDLATIMNMTVDEIADYCATLEGAAMSGCWYLASRGCLILADAWQLSKITLKVNGSAMLGNSQRIAYANAMLKALGS